MRRSTVLLVCARVASGTLSPFRRERLLLATSQLGLVVDVASVVIMVVFVRFEWLCASAAPRANAKGGSRPGHPFL